MNLFSGCALRLDGDKSCGLLSVRGKAKLECLCIESGPSIGFDPSIISGESSSSRAAQGPL